MHHVYFAVGSKRKSNGGAEDGGPEVKQVERKYVEHFYIKKCPPKNLANIMKKETKPLYCHLYPTGKSPEDTFYKYLEGRCWIHTKACLYLVTFYHVQIQNMKINFESNNDFI